MKPALLEAEASYARLSLESSFEPVSSRRTFEEAVEQIAERIKAGDLHMGDRLPSERDLAAQMRISRPTLREAVKVLAEADGVTPIEVAERQALERVEAARRRGTHRSTPGTARRLR